MKIKLKFLFLLAFLTLSQGHPKTKDKKQSVTLKSKYLSRQDQTEDSSSDTPKISHDPPSVNNPANENKLYFKLGGYIGAWRSDEEIKAIPMDFMDTLYYAFINVDPVKKRCILPQMENEKILHDMPTTFDSLKKIRSANPSIRIMASVGGWKFSAALYEAAMLSDDESLEKLAASCFDLIDSYGIFDGIDLNLMFPCPKGRICRESFNKITDDDTAQFTKVVKTFRKHLVDEYKLSLTTTGDPELASVIDFAALEGDYDWLNLLTYDLHTKKGAYSGHHTNPYPSGEEADSRLSASTIGEYYTDVLGVKAAKINIGTAFYARGFRTKGSCEYKLSVRCMIESGVSARIEDHEADYRRIKSEFLYLGTQVQVDTKAKAKYVYDNGDIYSFEDVSSIKHKIKIINEKQYSGLFIWELAMDSEDFELLNSIYQTKKIK